MKSVMKNQKSLPNQIVIFGKSIGNVDQLPNDNLLRLTNKYQAQQTAVDFIGFENIDLQNGQWYQHFGKQISKTIIDPNLFDAIEYIQTSVHPKSRICSHFCKGNRLGQFTTLIFVETKKPFGT